MTTSLLSQPLLRRTHRFALAIVPLPCRDEWSREWQAELWHLGRRPSADRQHRISLARGMLADAIWLRADSIRATTPGSPSLCLLLLAAGCVLMAVSELFVAGSFHAFALIVTTHFFKNYLLIAVAAIFAAVVTHPLRPMRRHGTQSFEELLSARVRRTLFLTVRITLTLTLGFFAILFALSPFHFAGRFITGWAELILDAIIITVSLRHILLNQEQRCQRCLRTLNQPTRAGSPSRNFLYWSGTELTCSEGHGMLQVPAMRGSWCWYDRWVEDNSAWLVATIQS